MKYRIKIITYKNGRKTYCPQFRTLWLWVALTYDGGTDPCFPRDFEFRESALSCIDKHFAGNKKKQTIDFEYVNK